MCEVPLVAHKNKKEHVTPIEAHSLVKIIESYYK